MSAGDSPRLEDAARHLAEALRALGVEPAGPNLAGTPARVAELWADLFAGHDPTRAHELTPFPNPDRGDSLVLAARLPFHAMCAHHLLPFFGRAHVGFLPADRLVGFGAIARLVDDVARKPTLQEQMGTEIADALEQALAPRGVAVLIEGRHLCMEMRGARRRARMESTIWRGAFSTDESRRMEFLARVSEPRRGSAR
ncbi:MAG: GTP cyclohydrolase I FolE [Candidatus Eisenbacteria bacterium]